MKNLEKILKQNGVKIIKREATNGEFFIRFPKTDLVTSGKELSYSSIGEEKDVDIALTELLVGFAIINIKEIQDVKIVI